jgi:hypothetical protein
VRSRTEKFNLGADFCVTEAKVLNIINTELGGQFTLAAQFLPDDWY